MHSVVSAQLSPSGPFSIQMLPPPLPRFEVGLLDFVPKSTPCTAGTPLEQHNAGQKHASPAIEALFFLNKLPRTPSPFFSSG